MRILLVFTLLIFGSAFADRIAAQDKAEIEVIKFSWNKYDSPQEREPTEEDDPSIFKRLNRTNPNEEKSVEARSEDLRNAERDAVRNSLIGSKQLFLYELKIKNSGGENIRSFIWEYRDSKETAPPDSPVRRFLCSEKIKAGDTKTLRIFSSLPPSNVVDAAAVKNKSVTNYALNIVINRIEYADGTVWQKSDWDNSRYETISPQVAKKLKINPCAVL